MFALTSGFSRLVVTIAISLALAQELAAQAPPPLVVETDPLPPEQQRGMFHLPPGFEIQLVASEPDIGQPMNMNFDARGRLWVTSSVEYPYPVAGEGVEPREEKWGMNENRPARDWVTVLSGIDDTGKPVQVTRFAEGLNIPIGIIPDGDGAIIYSIPNIERFRDTDGDGRADERTKLYGPFGNVDTHGMAASFTRGLDGWIYATHGFRNTTKIQGTDGHVVEMNSGNTFRFRPDGSRVEHWTHGQVNPFGLCFDPWGNLYSADCHSMPLTCLLRGAYYQSFGKPHDGLGFGPDMIDHNHGSTGICGCAWYEAEQFPAEHNGCIFLCNPVTGRVHRDKIEFRGSSPWAVTQPDFITCDDGWFRPVDVKLGPDGALYIADFYNAIIGHYEVPLEHPRRDRTHGRIWRVVYRGESSVESRVSSVESPEQKSPESPAVATAGTAPAQFDLTKLSLDELIDRLGDPNLTVRSLATQFIAATSPFDEFNRKVVAATAEEPPNPELERRIAHGLRIAGQFNQLPEHREGLAKRLIRGLILTHWLQALAEQSVWSEASQELADVATAPSEEGHARRAAAEAISVRPFAGSLETHKAFSLYPAVIGPIHDDTQYFHAIRIGIRNQLAIPENVDYVLRERLFDPNDGRIHSMWIEFALAMHEPNGSRILLAALPMLPGTWRTRAIVEVTRFGTDAQKDELILRLSGAESRVETRSAANDLRSLLQGLQERGSNETGRLQEWGTRLAKELLDVTAAPELGWTPVAYGPNAKPESAFGTQTRPFSDGQQGALLHSSFPPGETGTGILRSDAFDLPAKFSFFIAGHNGLPSTPEKANNLVRLRDAETQAVLHEALPPRNDTAQLVEWDLAPHQGRRGFIEIVDGDDRTAYAWLAVGRFSVDGLNPAAESPQLEGCKLVAELKLTELAPNLAELVRSVDTPASLRGAAAGALLALRPDARLSVLREAAGSTTQPPELRESCYAVIAIHRADAGSIGDAADASRISNDAGTLLKQVIQSAPADDQRQLATLLAGDRDGAAALLDLVQQGAASPRLLQEAALVERLRTWNLDGFDDRLAKLTADLPAPDAALAELLTVRREQFHAASDALDAARGQALFKQHCAACHQLGGEGARIGPQLDGIGLRGPDRLLEDVLDPNRNVDAAFRTTILVLGDGRSLTGLIRREEGATLVLADNQGKEFTVATADIEQRKDSTLSLMPAQLVEKLPGADLNHLIAYLLTTRSPPATGAKQTPRGLE